MNTSYTGNPGDPGHTSQSVSRANFGEEPNRSLFDPGGVEEEWKPRENLCLSQEQAEVLDKNREPGDVKYVMRVIDDIEKYLRWRQETIDASYADYKRIHMGNLEERLRLQTGNHDVPSGRKNSTVDGESSPFAINLKDFRLKLKKGQNVMQVMYYDWSFSDEQGGPGGSSLTSEVVDERPDGWLPVREISRVKDQTQSAITRAIRHGELSAVMQESPQKRWVRPDEDLETWSPGRQENYLLRRRLKLIKETIHSQLDRPRGERILSLSGTMAHVRRLEARRFGPDHTPDDYQEFFEEALSHPPTSMIEWVKRAHKLVDIHCR